MEKFDTIVLGTGGVGSATLYHLARRGVRVLGLDRFPPGHDRGSSHGRTRLIRQAYYEHPDYVPLLFRAYELWAELEKQTNQHLYHEVGVLQVGAGDGVVLPGVLASARLHGLDVEKLTPAELARRFPGFRIPDSLAAVFERRAGYLLVEDCVRTHADLAVKHGADLRTGGAVLSWRPEGSGVIVETEQGTFAADSLVISAGAWAGGLLADLGVKLEVIRKSLYWFEAPPVPFGEEAGFPGFLFETPQGNFYGFPRLDETGLKVAEHTLGLPVADPLTVSREPDAAETARVEQFLTDYMPAVSRRQINFATCLYTLSPDRHFIIDRHPLHSQVSFAAGLSGHGFKFTSVLGEVLADLSQQGQTALPIGFLSVNRFAGAAR